MRLFRCVSAALAAWGISAIPMVVAPAEAQLSATRPAGALPTALSARRTTALPNADIRLAVLAHPMLAAAGEDAADRAAVLAFYGCTADAPMWTTETGLTPRALAVMAEIGRADDWGLSAKDFALPAAPSGQPTIAERAEFEAKLSLAVLKYARHARGGRIADPATQLASYLDRKPLLIEPGMVLAGVAAGEAPDAYLRALHPQHPQFERLRQQYLKVRGAGGHLVVIPKGPILRPGDTHPSIALLRQRLRVPLGSMSDGKPADPNVYDDALAAAAKQFQKDNGISQATGTIGERTRAALNDEVDTDAPLRILANMEAWRWMPGDLGRLHVMVNVPEFTVRVVKDGKVIHAERVVTGRKETQTPIFSDRMKTVVFQPQWGLPDSIKVNEVLPRLLAGDGLKDGYRMQRNGRDIDPEDVDWRKANILEYHVFQPSGDDNALGQVKFLFPNKHQVYMHDTPSKRLFNETTRTYSHGCVRVRNPQKLAELILAEDKGWDAKKVRRELDDGPENNRITLDAAVPVHITYFTASVDDAGKLQLYNDIYEHEDRITLALQGKWSEIPKLPDHLAPLPMPEKVTKAQVKKPREVRETREADASPPPVRRRAKPQVAWVPPPPPQVRRPPPTYYAPRYGLTRQAPQKASPVKTFFQKLFGD